MKRYRVTHTLHCSRDGLVSADEARAENLYVEIDPYVSYGVEGYYYEDDGFLKSDATGYEYYIGKEWLEEIA